MSKNIRTLEESVVMAMDGSGNELYPFLPYILQDLWELGTPPDTIINLINNYYNTPRELKVLDLGCGKGDVSVQVSQQLGCFCHGIDDAYMAAGGFQFKSMNR